MDDCLHVSTLRPKSDSTWNCDISEPLATMLSISLIFPKHLSNVRVSNG